MMTSINPHIPYQLFLLLEVEPANSIAHALGGLEKPGFQGGFTLAPIPTRSNNQNRFFSSSPEQPLLLNNADTEETIEDDDADVETGLLASRF